jgi:riboflavin kinase/FMN adenylyltransferase
LGKELGFPTANVQLNRYSAPISGVFAVLVRVGDKLYKAAANVGVRPTVGDLVKPILEVHILDFDKDIYGERIEVEFKHKIRDEKKFTSLDNLVENIQNDINKIRAWFHQANNN